MEFSVESLPRKILLLLAVDKNRNGKSGTRLNLIISRHHMDPYTLQGNEITNLENLVVLKKPITVKDSEYVSMATSYDQLHTWHRVSLIELLVDLTPRFSVCRIGAYRLLRRDRARLRDRWMSWILPKFQASIFVFEIVTNKQTFFKDKF